MLAAKHPFEYPLNTYTDVFELQISMPVHPITYPYYKSRLLL